MTPRPRLCQTALDTTDVRGLAEFYRELLGLVYRPGDEPPMDGGPDDADWLVLRTPEGAPALAFQKVCELTPTTWPSAEVPMQLHIDMTVPCLDSLTEARRRAESLGATLIMDRSDAEDEPLYVFGDPAGHPFCVFVTPVERRQLATLAVDDQLYVVARAQRRDVPTIVELLRDDTVGSSRESEDLTIYYEAFERIDADPAHMLAVLLDDLERIVATLQLTLLPGLARQGATRLQIEAVRVAPHLRSSGVGTALFDWAHRWGRHHGATMAQLTTDVRREDAHRFYDRLGYETSHHGLKLALA
ncbi:GNAT family N-acetyltransferase [Arsenicicoccus dermatophilus]|uniref:GNAT family N-acetyltransferase n=1 Tax=Arsenicicoccus dermatophilus TaxID=1076331 RepID=UPI003892BDBF